MDTEYVYVEDGLQFKCWSVINSRGSWPVIKFTYIFHVLWNRLCLSDLSDVFGSINMEGSHYLLNDFILFTFYDYTFLGIDIQKIRFFSMSQVKLSLTFLVTKRERVECWFTESEYSGTCLSVGTRPKYEDNAWFWGRDLPTYWWCLHSAAPWREDAIWFAFIYWETFNFASND